MDIQRDTAEQVIAEGRELIMLAAQVSKDDHPGILRRAISLKVLLDELERQLSEAES